MSTTGNRAYPYPQLTDDFDPPGDLQALAVAIDADVQAVASPPVCKVTQATGAGQTGWTTATGTALTFGAGSTVVDTLGIHSESVNTSRLVIGGKLGWWEISGNYCPITNTTGVTEFRAWLAKNGTAIWGSHAGPGGDSTKFNSLCTPVVEVEATASGDYVELFGYMTSTGTPRGSTTSAPYVASGLSAKWIRES